LALAVLAVLCLGAAADYVEVFIKWDNTIAQTNKANKAILEELAKELCKIPVNRVGTIRTLDKSILLNTESHGYYACQALSKEDAGKIITNCNKKNLQKEFMDELEDRTTPDQEAEGITCTLKGGVAVAGH